MILQKTLSNLLRNIADNLDAGNSNLTEEEAISYCKSLSELDSSLRLSKTLACQYLNLPRSTFDDYVTKGLIPKGEKLVGFKELSWKKVDLDIALNEIKKYKKPSL